MPVTLELPTIQNWSCHSCSGCCRQHGIHITDEEKQRIESQNWTPDDGIPAEQPLFVKMGRWPFKRWWRLAHQPDGACVFLQPDGLCRIHAKFGEPAKPLACRIYPYTFHPKGNRVAVSVRFSCPSVVKNLGRGVVLQKQELQEIADRVVPSGVTKLPPPDLTPGTRLDWPDTLRVVESIDRSLASTTRDADGKTLPTVPLSVRLIRILHWLDLLEQSQLAAVQGERLSELLKLLCEATAAEFPHDFDTSPLGEPTRTGRVQFRLLAGQYARKDSYGSNPGIGQRWQMFKNALRLMRGTGNIPAIQECFNEVPFTTLEQAGFGLPAEANEILTRFLQVKVRGMHFCGRAYYDVPVIEGFRSLVLLVASVLWIARWIAVGAGRTQLIGDDIAEALAIADHHHGYSPVFGTFGFRGRAKTLSKLGDVPRLVAWYS